MECLGRKLDEVTHHGAQMILKALLMTSLDEPATAVEVVRLEDYDKLKREFDVVINHLHDVHHCNCDWQSEAVRDGLQAEKIEKWKAARVHDVDEKNWLRDQMTALRAVLRDIMAAAGHSNLIPIALEDRARALLPEGKT
jgi:hypothetical protein